MEEKRQEYDYWCQLSQYIILMRPIHWVKSFFVFIGPLYAGAFVLLPQVCWVACAFCMLASAVYIYNDVQDVVRDKAHPVRSQRPLAAGTVPVNSAIALLGVLLLLVFFIALFLPYDALWCFLGYIFVNILYNHLLKFLPIGDVLCIAMGFMLRILAGALGVGLTPSWWLIFAATSLCVCIALCKRRVEKNSPMHMLTRPVLRKYTLPVLDGLMNITGFLCIGVYILYVFWVRAHAIWFVLTIPCAIAGVWRLLILSRRPCVIDDPMIVFFRDAWSCFNAAVFLLLTVLAVL